MHLATDSRRLDAAFFALSDATRRGILVRLAHGEATVNELTGAFAISQPAISRHLKVLEQAGLIARRRDAQRRPAVIERQPIAQLEAWIERYRKLWESTYQRLDAALADELDARNT
ncbi:MAG: winged helix-turn-helix transcriptional regulator [Candidatus Eremiobacteraeota bacterium]|nr:winged helix-turn-helix transcriptional regulator [Candidatus Eremiobacteraeota bacterium]MBV8433003.1 winged helix-turn-helix transcriptional regulator [Candidatus Eremiobacteraeota bacterium]MBV8583351.1 winged helix-turn-helix transcriptional regulator [Candidatus Eremiobacteraeota bacterium]